MAAVPRPWMRKEGKPSRWKDAFSPSPDQLVFFLVNLVTLNLIFPSCIFTLSSFLALPLPDTVNTFLGSISDTFPRAPVPGPLSHGPDSRLWSRAHSSPCPQAPPLLSFCHPAYMVMLLKYKSDHITLRLETMPVSPSFQCGWALRHLQTVRGGGSSSVP